MIDSHPALKRYALLLCSLGLLVVPLLISLRPEQQFITRGETVRLPEYMSNAAPVFFSSYQEDLRIVVSMPNEGETYLGKDRSLGEELIEGLKKQADARPENDRIVYLKAGAGVSHQSIIEALQRIRVAGIHRVRLVVKKEKVVTGGYRTGFLEVNLQPEFDLAKDYPKIDPLMLVVSIESDGKLRLNDERMGDISDTDQLASTLSEIFRERETHSDGAHEKTVFIKGSPSLRYDLLAGLIYALSGTGASPITIQLDKDLPARMPPPKPAGDKLSLRP